MKGDHIFHSALRTWAEPPELEPVDEPLTLTEEGVCPYCRVDLDWDGIDDTRAWCSTPGCPYDPTKSEAANRHDWLGGKR